MVSKIINWPEVYKMAGLGEDKSLRDSPLLVAAITELEVAADLLREASFQSRLPVGVKETEK